MASDAQRWVPETRFGVWFQRTEIWLRYVLAPAVDEFGALLGPGDRRFRSILDVGCGEGLAFRLLEERFRPDVISGLDIDAQLIERARVAAERCSCRVEARAGDAAKLELPDASVDLVFCHQTLHHLCDQEGAIHEFHRVLEPGGVLLLAESCRRFTHSLPVRLLFRHPMELQKSAAEYLKLLRSAGFAFEPRDVGTPCPFWSQPDFGLRELLGRPVRTPREPTLVQVAASHPH